MQLINNSCHHLFVGWLWLFHWLYYRCVLMFINLEHQSSFEWVRLFFFVFFVSFWHGSFLYLFGCFINWNRLYWLSSYFVYLYLKSVKKKWFSKFKFPSTIEWCAYEFDWISISTYCLQMYVLFIFFFWLLV